MNSVLIYIGNRIREERKAQNLSQECLAEDANISATSIRGIENGKTDMKLTTFMEIVSALDTSPLELLPGRFSENDGIDEWILNLGATLSRFSDKKRQEVKTLIDGIIVLSGAN